MYGWNRAEQFISSTADGIHRLWMFNESLFTNQLAINTYEWLCYHPKPLPVPQELESIPRFYRKTLASNLSTLHWLDCHSMRRLCPKKHASLTAEIFHYYAEILFAVLSDGTLVFWGIQVDFLLYAIIVVDRRRTSIAGKSVR